MYVYPDREIEPHEKHRELRIPSRLGAPGLALDGCEMHHKLLAAYDKIHAAV